MKKENNISEPLVSVCLITYNHCQFIKQAIDGVLMQKVNFDWEFIIADDYSTDGTRDIIKEYAKKFPSLIRLILQEKNVGAGKNWMDLMASPKGKYVAYLEGDDYWTHQDKLQIQLDILEKNLNCILSFHKTIIYHQHINYYEVQSNIPHNYKIYTSYDLMKENFINSSSIMFKNGIINIPSSFLNYPVGDYPFYIILSLYGKIHYTDKCMSVYRVGCGSWTQRPIIERSKKIITIYFEILKLLLFIIFKSITNTRKKINALILVLLCGRKILILTTRHMLMICRK